MSCPIRSFSGSGSVSLASTSSSPGSSMYPTEYGSKASGPSYGGDGGRKSWVVNVHSVPRSARSRSFDSSLVHRTQVAAAGKLTRPHTLHSEPISRRGAAAGGQVNRPSATGRWVVVISGPVPVAQDVGVRSRLGHQVRDDGGQLLRCPAGVRTGGGAVGPALQDRDPVADDAEHPAGDLARGGRAQPYHQRRDGLGGQVLHLGGLLHHLDVLGQPGQRGGRDGVHRHAVAGEFGGGDEGETGESGLRGTVVGLAGVAEDAGRGGRVDHPGVVVLPGLGALAPVRGRV